MPPWVAPTRVSGYLDNMSVLVRSTLPRDPLRALHVLTSGQAELDELRRETVRSARSDGASWEQIAQALGVSRQAAWEAFNRPVRDAVAANATSNNQAGLGEDEAMKLAVNESREVRRHQSG